MRPGQELDILIAKKVMKLSVGSETFTNKNWTAPHTHTYYSIGKPSWHDNQGEMYLSNPLPNYSTDITAAWEIINKLPYLVTLTTNNPYHPTTPETEWFCSFQEEYEAEGESAAHAICLAALKAIGEEIT